MDNTIREVLSFLADMIIRTRTYSGIKTIADTQRVLDHLAGGDFSDFEQGEQEEQEESKPKSLVLDMNANLRRIPVLINGMEYYAYVSSITQEKAGVNMAGTDLFTAKIELTAPYIPFISR